MIIIEDCDKKEEESFLFSLKNYNDLKINEIEYYYQIEIIGVNEKTKYSLYDVDEEIDLQLQNNKTNYLKFGLANENKKYKLKLDLKNSIFESNTNIKIKINAEYNLSKEFDCMSLKVDKEPPSYNITYSTEEWTNESVTIKVEPSEEINGIEGFDFVDGFYIREVQENEEKNLIITDLAGNEANLNYKIWNIDKTPPKISGIDNQEKYNISKKVEYIDNESKIANIEKTFYGSPVIDYNFNNKSLTISVLRIPKNCVSLKYYRNLNGKENFIISNKQKIVFNNVNTNASYYVIATDLDGNTYKSNVISKIKEKDFTSSYNLNEDNNTFSNDGFYDIKVTDNAGNETFYSIEINKNK